MPSPKKPEDSNKIVWTTSSQSTNDSVGYRASTPLSPTDHLEEKIDYATCSEEVWRKHLAEMKVETEKIAREREHKKDAKLKLAQEQEKQRIESLKPELQKKRHDQIKEKWSGRLGELKGKLGEQQIINLMQQVSALKDCITHIDPYEENDRIANVRKLEDIIIFYKKHFYFDRELDSLTDRDPQEGLKDAIIEISKVANLAAKEILSSKDLKINQKDKDDMIKIIHGISKQMSDMSEILVSEDPNNKLKI